MSYTFPPGVKRPQDRKPKQSRVVASPDPISVESTRENLGTIWCCMTCSDSDADEPPVPTEGEPQAWALIDPSYWVERGLPRAEHGCEQDSEWCECEQTTFSRSQCEGCGSYLHGAREAFQLWRSVPTTSGGAA